jgi:hypothetical protein
MSLSAGHRAVYVAAGLPISAPSVTTGMVALPVNYRGALGPVRAASESASSASGVALSAGGRYLAFGTTNAQALGFAVNDTAYPKAIRITAGSSGGRITVSGTTTSLRVSTDLFVYVKDLTKKEARFVKQAKSTYVAFEGDLRWTGKAPSKRFAIYVAGGGAKSRTVTVTVR